MSSVSELYRVTEVELIYRNKQKPAERLQIRSSKDSYAILLESWDKNKMDLVEQFKILLLNRNNRCLGISLISTGGMTGCIVDTRIVFATALKAGATGIVLAHNHPSGSMIPSQQDKNITRNLSAAGKLLDLDVLDHLILTSNGYFSMTDEGLHP